MNIKDEVNKYLLEYSKTNICFPKLCVTNGKITEREEYSSLVDSLFGMCGYNEGIEIWIVQKTNSTIPEKMEKIPTTIKELSKGANYIFLHTYNTINKEHVLIESHLNHNIYFWIGSENNTHINFSTSYYISILSYQMKPNQVFREEANDESVQFKKIFE